MTDTLELTAKRIADRGRDALVARLRPAFADAASAHRAVLQLDDDQLEQMVQRAADRADGLQWRRALAMVASEELGIGLGEALGHPAVERAQAIVGAPSYSDSLAALEARPDAPVALDRRPKVAPPAQAQPKPTWAEPKPTQAEPAPALAEPAPALAEPAPAPGESKPAQIESKPAQGERTPDAAEPTPARAEPTPARAEPTPAQAGDKPTRPDPEATRVDTATPPTARPVAAQPEPRVGGIEREPQQPERTVGPIEREPQQPERTVRRIERKPVQPESDVTRVERLPPQPAPEGRSAEERPAEPQPKPASAAAQAGPRPAGAEAGPRPTAPEAGPRPAPRRVAPTARSAEPEGLRVSAIHLGGVTNLKPGESEIELRLSEHGLDIAREGGEIIGRLAWDEIDGLEVPPPRGFMWRRRAPRSHLVVRAAHGDASFEIPSVYPDELTQHLGPMLQRYGRGLMMR